MGQYVKSCSEVKEDEYVTTSSCHEDVFSELYCDVDCS